MVLGTDTRVLTLNIGQSIGVYWELWIYKPLVTSYQKSKQQLP